MAVQTDEVRELIDFAPEGFLVTSVYLNTDATEFVSDDLVDTSFDSLMHAAESRRKEIEDGLSHEGEESLRSDLAKIREFYAEKFDRTDTNGLAIFSCSGEDFWEVVHMPDKVENAVYFEPRPYIAPLATFLSHTKPTAILLTDRVHARIFTMEGGEAREWTDFEDFVPRRSQAGGWSQMRYQRRSDHWAKHHIDHAAELTLKLLQHYPFDWLILGTETEAENDLESGLHPYLKDRVIGQVRVRIDADPADVLAKAREVREQKETRYIEELMQRVQEYAGAGGRGTIGLIETLQALNEQKVHIMLVQEGFSQPGSRCDACSMLMPEIVESCPACGEPATVVENIVDSALQRALELGSTVEVSTEFEKLAPIQCIGSIMYY